MEQLIQQLNFNLLVVRLERGDGELNATILRANRHLAKLLGYAEQELIGRPLASILAAGDTVAARLLDAASQSDVGGDSCIEAEIVTKQQQHHQALLSLSAWPGHGREGTDFLLLVLASQPGDDFLVMRRVIEQSASAMMITDAAGFIEYVNPKFSELTGYSANELLGQTPKMLQSGKMPREYYQSMWDSLIHSGEWQGELRNKHKQGHDYWVYERVSAIKNAMGDITHFLAIEEDVTLRKTVESALAESEQRFRQMAELSGEWLWEQDAHGFYLYSSIAVKQILGLSEAEIVGKHYTALLTLQDREAQSGLSTNHHAFHALVNHYRHKDGHLVITESTGLPILDNQGQLLKWRGVDRDITAKMQFQDALIESEKRTRLIIEGSINAIVIMDAYGIVSDWNQRAENMFGWTAEEAIGRRLDALIIPERFQDAHRAGMRRFLDTGVGPILNRQTEQIARRRDGSEFPVEVSVSPLKLGNSYIFSGFIHDISGRRAAERQIREAQVDLAVARNEIKIAQQIQANLFPAAPIKTDDFEIAGYCLPADKIGGDYYDYFYRGDSRLHIVIADVSGHSIGPALFMVETRSALRGQTGSAATAAEIMAALNRFLFHDLDQADYFITLFYMQVDRVRQQLSFANAGHPPPLLFNRRLGQFSELDADGLILGIKAEVEFEEKSVQLTGDDVILFYTDGLTEAENADGEFFGLERVKAIFRRHASASPQAIIDALIDGLKLFCRRTNFSDDISLMVFQRR